MATKISWTEETWNPSTGCDKTSPGCDSCYALSMARRLKAMGLPKYQADGDPRTSGPGFGIAEHAEVVTLPLHWRKPRRVFVNSMSDLFHSGVSDGFIARVFAVMAACPHHTFQVLTKRHARMRSLLNDAGWFAEVAQQYRMLETGIEPEGLPWPSPNVWMGVSCEDQKWADIRIPALLDTPAAVRWISAEPILGPIDLTGRLGDCACDGGYTYEMSCGAVHEPGCGDSDGLDWAVLGGESGPGARPMDLQWARSIIGQCRESGVPVFVKQLGSAAGMRDHHDMETFPADLQVREFPEVVASC